MNYKDKEKIRKAKDMTWEIRSAYAGMFNYHCDDKDFASLMSTISNFLGNQVDDVCSAIDSAMDEIERLEDENRELQGRIRVLEDRED